MNTPRRLLLLLLSAFAAAVAADEASPDLPPTDAVIRVLLAHPEVEAAGSGIRAEEANRARLIAGPHEWSLRIGGQRREVRPAAAAEQRFGEWSAALERPLRLPGKGATDAEIGARGVALAETARGDALHENARALLKGWFAWLREHAAANQWRAQSELLGRQAGTIVRRQQLGDAARIDGVLAEAALAQAEAQRTQAEARERTARDELIRRFPGLPLGEPIASDPQPLDGDAESWIAAVIEHSHELALARGEAERARLLARRMRQERLPDPSVGVQFSRERGGEERVLGAYVSIPLPGSARFAAADTSAALADAAASRASAAERRIAAEAAALHESARAGFASWQASRDAAERLARAADMTARAYQLGEGSLSDLLLARRQAHEAQLAATLARLEARERHARLRLDAHQLWDFD